MADPIAVVCGGVGAARFLRGLALGVGLGDPDDLVVREPPQRGHLARGMGVARPDLAHLDLHPRLSSASRAQAENGEPRTRQEAPPTDGHRGPP